MKKYFKHTTKAQIETLRNSERKRSETARKGIEEQLEKLRPIDYQEIEILQYIPTYSIRPELLGIIKTIIDKFGYRAIVRFKIPGGYIDPRWSLDIIGHPDHLKDVAHTIDYYIKAYEQIRDGLIDRQKAKNKYQREKARKLGHKQPRVIRAEKAAQTRLDSLVSYLERSIIEWLPKGPNLHKTVMRHQIDQALTIFPKGFLHKGKTRKLVKNKELV